MSIDDEGQKEVRGLKAGDAKSEVDSTDCVVSWRAKMLLLVSSFVELKVKYFLPVACSSFHLPMVPPESSMYICTIGIDSKSQ